MALKALEGSLRFLFDTLLGVFGTDEATREAAGVLLPHLFPLAAEFEPENTGGAMLLGTDGVCVISHGSSNATAMMNAVLVAHECATRGLADHVAAAVRRPNQPESPAQGGKRAVIRPGGTYTGPVPAETHTNQGPLDRNGVFELIRDQLADILETDPSSITEGASFVEDLDADSLALIELVEALEEELGERTVGFRINDEDLEDLRTVRDAVDYVYAKLEAG